MTIQYKIFKIYLIVCLLRNGIRTSKSRNGVTYNYIYDGNTLVAEQHTNGTVSEWLYYVYGIDGIAGFRYNGITYLYRKNVQGDVTHIYKQEADNTLTLVAKYLYDAWGNHDVFDANDEIDDNANSIGNLNPFRYRSYYFDSETGLYYLKTRYYDPELGRFISADSIEYLDPETLGGLNLYAYCGNNPVMKIDSSGTKGEWWQWLVFGLVTAVAVALVVVANVLSLGTVGTIMAAVGAGFLIGAGGSLVEQLVNNNWQFSELDPIKTLEDGGRAALISGMCAVGSVVLGQVGTVFGKEFGASVARFSKSGISVGKVFGGTETITGIFEFLGKTLGVLAGGMIGEKMSNEILGEQSAFEDLLKKRLPSIIEGWFFDGIGGAPWERFWNKLRQRFGTAR